jgi:hypothetical protein
VKVVAAVLNNKYWLAPKVAAVVKTKLLQYWQHLKVLKVAQHQDAPWPIRIKYWLNKRVPVAIK